ncbi:hypothetical protein [Pseudomonas sp. ICMP 10191]|uniref:hypothetical protein n=1 Tax=Pseudomonas sp. ICMP 10191 TaxID=1198294 RepID=UPI0007317D3F|nr:hypothetical protein [Pseudomonas sp. ICMP 10191]KTC16712.1 hypothetical protein AO388_17510 [Pseudomonas sp. ICMP 10191]
MALMKSSAVEVLTELEAAGVDIKNICQQLLAHIALTSTAEPRKLKKIGRPMSPGARFRRELKRRGLRVVPFDAR